jgi:hypothetical protein
MRLIISPTQRLHQSPKFEAGRIFNFAYSPSGKQLALSRGSLNSDVFLIKNSE